MCLVLHKKEYQEIHIAKEDIPIFKAVRAVCTTKEMVKPNLCYKTPYRLFPIQFNFEYVVELQELSHFGMYIGTQDRYLSYRYPVITRYADVGFHTFEPHQRCIRILQESDDSGIIYFKGIIPKGSQYYHNPEIGLYCSSAVKYFEKLEKFEFIGDYPKLSEYRVKIFNSPISERMWKPGDTGKMENGQVRLDKGGLYFDFDERWDVIYLKSTSIATRQFQV